MTPRDAGVRFIKKLRDHVINSLISHAKNDEETDLSIWFRSRGLTVGAWVLPH